MKRRTSIPRVALVAAMLIMVIALPLLGACTKEVVKEVPVEKSEAKEAPKEVAKEAPKEVAKEEEPKGTAYSLGTGSVGSVSYSIGIAVARIAEKHAGYPTTAEASGGEQATLKAMAAKKLELGAITSDSLFQGARGLAPFFSDVGKVPVRLLFSGNTNAYQLITLKPEIQTLQDIKGRVFMWRNTASIIHMSLGQSLVDYMVKTYGWSENAFTTADRKSSKLAFDSLANGTVDVTTTLAKGGAAMDEMVVALKGRFHYVPFPEDALDYMIKQQPVFQRVTIPKGLIQGYPPEDFPTVGSAQLVACRADLPESTVYAIVKGVFDNFDEYLGMLPEDIRAEWTIETALASPGAPFHPGAVRYYKEKGVWTAELDKLQNQLLAEVQ